MLTYSKALYQSRDLLWSWTGRIIRGRYQQSALGWLWAVIQPAAQVLIFSLIFTRFVPVETGGIPYPVFSYLAIVPWTLLSASVLDMSQSLVSNMNLVTKIYFPREVLPISALLARLMDFGVAVGLLVVLMVMYHVKLFVPGLLVLPIIFVSQLLLILGLGLASAAANVFFRDVQSLLTLGFQVWFYASPIIYPISMVPKQLQQWYFLNPMAGILESYRDVLLSERMPGNYLYLAFLISLLVFVVGYWFFKKIEFQIADVV
jgi:lipopolysaccharide transport system permease protein